MNPRDVIDMNSFPYTFNFRIGTIHNDFTVKDASDTTRAYVKAKLFNLKEHVEIFSDESQKVLIYSLKANKWLDFNTTYNFTRADGSQCGRLARKGWKSLWKVMYEIYDENDQQDLTIREANPWASVGDSLLSEIPILGIFTGYFFNPSYNITRPDGTIVAKFKKMPSFFGRKFELTQVTSLEDGEEERIKLGLMMMALLERRKG